MFVLLIYSDIQHLTPMKYFPQGIVPDFFLWKEDGAINWHLYRFPPLVWLTIVFIDRRSVRSSFYQQCQCHSHSHRLPLICLPPLPLPLLFLPASSLPSWTATHSLLRPPTIDPSRDQQAQNCKDRRIFINAPENAFRESTKTCGGALKTFVLHPS